MTVIWKVSAFLSNNLPLLFTYVSVISAVKVEIAFIMTFDDYVALQSYETDGRQ